MREIRRVVFFVYNPFVGSELYCKRLGEDVFEENGIEFEIFDFSKIFKPELYKHYLESNSQIYKANSHTVFDNIEDALSAISKLNKTHTMVFDEGVLGSEVFRNCFNKTGVSLGVYVLGTWPSFGVREKGFSSVAVQFIRNPWKIIQKIKQRLFATRGAVNYPVPDLCLASGMKSIEMYRKKYNLKSTTKIVWAHNYDYDFCLDRTDDITFSDKAVYLDQAIGLNSDDYLIRQAGGSFPTIQYPLLNSVFGEIESITGLEIEIAGHPRMPVNEISERFPGRVVRQNDTFNLIRKSSLIIAHWSTSIQMAVILRKPILLLTSNNLRKTGYDEHIRNISQELDCEIINIDSGVDAKKVKNAMSIDKKKYDQYIENYVKVNGSEMKKAWQILVDSIV